MKRSGWITCLIVGGLAGVVAAAWSRPANQAGGPESGLIAGPMAGSQAKCNSAEGEACKCGTGANRAALMMQAPQSR